MPVPVTEKGQYPATIKDDLKADVVAGDIAKLENEGKCGKEEAEDSGSASGDNVDDDEDNDFDEDTDWSHGEEG